MTLTHGLDPERLRTIGASLVALGGRTSGVRDEGSAMVAALAEVWVRPDSERLAADWSGVESRVSQAATALETYGRRALEQAAEQEGASSTSTGSGGGAAGSGETGTAPTAAAALGAPVAGVTPIPPINPFGRVEDGRKINTETRNQDEREDTRRGAQEPPAEPRKKADELGKPVEGESLDTRPEPPQWSPVDQGAGEYDSEFAGPVDRATHAAARAGADAKRDDWPDASRNLDHFLDNTGDPLEQDVDAMLAADDVLQASTQTQRDDLGQGAVDDARRRGITGPVTYPVSTNWKGHYIGPDVSENLYYATGGIEYSQVGEVTVYPPETPGGEYGYEVDTRVEYRDQYNWDGSKKTEIGPLTVTDEQLAALHRAGLAKEFEMYGQSSDQSSSGSVR